MPYLAKYNMDCNETWFINRWQWKGSVQEP